MRQPPRQLRPLSPPRRAHPRPARNTTTKARRRVQTTPRLVASLTSLSSRLRPAPSPRSACPRALMSSSRLRLAQLSRQLLRRLRLVCPRALPLCSRLQASRLRLACPAVTRSCSRLPARSLPLACPRAKTTCSRLPASKLLLPSAQPVQASRRTSRSLLCVARLLRPLSLRLPLSRPPLPSDRLAAAFLRTSLSLPRVARLLRPLPLRLTSSRHRLVCPTAVSLSRRLLHPARSLHPACPTAIRSCSRRQAKWPQLVCPRARTSSRPLRAVLVRASGDRDPRLASPAATILCSLPHPSLLSVLLLALLEAFR